MSRLRSLFQYKCPSCESGEVYEEKGILKFKMHSTCSNCGHKYEKEPGFFYGAMYVSYALGVAQIVATFVICQFFFDDVFDPLMLPFMIGILIVMAPINYKFSRVIWMYLFTKKKEVNAHS